MTDENHTATPTENSQGRPIRGWQVEGRDQEILSGDLQQAVEEAFHSADEIPESVTVVGYIPKELPPIEILVDWFLPDLYERLDEDYGPDERFDTRPRETPPPEVYEAAREMAKTIRETYEVWPCVPSDVRIEVDPRPFLCLDEEDQ